jgi:hypothetical protein
MKVTSLTERVRRFRRYTNGQGSIWSLLFFLRWLLLRIRLRKPIESLLVPIENLMMRIEKSRQISIETITYIELLRLEERDPYYSGRWDYYHEVIKLIERESPLRVLELGPNRAPVVTNSDTMDANRCIPHLTYLHDATITPFPVKDSAYDMFIALQVWEHLKGKQEDAFREVMRISKKAILSFPYKWNCPGNCHHNIDEEKIAEWTCHVPPRQVIRLGNRIIYSFSFENLGS